MIPSNRVSIDTFDELLIELRILNGSYAMQTDAASATVTYQGWAEPGTAVGSTGWRIKRITETSGDFDTAFADGNRNFDNIWNNRLALSYS